MSTSVFFIGGWNANQVHINAWVQSAQQQKPSIAFRGFPWPDGVTSSPGTSVVKGSKEDGQFKKVVDAIQACSADKIYIVGHSSGCAIANAVDKALTNTSKIVLVALDGFAPDGDQLKRSSTQVRAAVSGVHKSKNYKDLKDLLGSRLQEYSAKKDCTTKWALHFSLVNAAATDGLVHGVSTGYAQCEANLAWL